MEPRPASHPDLALAGSPLALDVRALSFHPGEEPVLRLCLSSLAAELRPHPPTARSCSSSLPHGRLSTMSPWTILAKGGPGWDSTLLLACGRSPLHSTESGPQAMPAYLLLLPASPSSSVLPHFLRASIHPLRLTPNVPPWGSPSYGYKEPLCDCQGPASFPAARSLAPSSKRGGLEEAKREWWRPSRSGPLVDLELWRVLLAAFYPTI